MTSKYLMGALALILALCMLAIPAVSDDNTSEDIPMLASSVSTSSLDFGVDGTVSISLSGATVTATITSYDNSMDTDWVVRWGDGTANADMTTRPTTTTNPSASYTYTGNGTYLITVTGSMFQQSTDNFDHDITPKTATVTIDTYSSESELNFTTPPTLDAISRSTFNYTPTVSVSGSTITKQSGASWLSFSNGKLTGTAPVVTSVTSYTAVLKATSPGGQTATQTVSVDVYPIAKLTASSTSVSGVVGTAIPTITISSNLEGNYSIYSGTLPAGLSLNTSTGKITGTPTSSADTTVTIRQTVSEGPAQYPTVRIAIDIDGLLSITSTAPTSIIKTGNTYEYTPTASINNVTWSISNAPSWLAVSNGKVIGSVPASYADATTVTYTLTATAGTQTKSQVCTINIEPTLTFTSIPTASMLVIPVVGYADDGSVVLGANADGLVLGENADKTSSDTIDTKTTMTYQFVFTGSNAETLLWDFGDGKTSTEWSPIHTYEKAGTYTVTLTATNKLGSDTCTYKLVVDDPNATNYLMWIIIAIAALLILYIVFGKRKRKGRY